MAYSHPLGLQQLIAISEVKVRQLNSWFKKNEYAVLTLKDDVILQAKKEANAFNVLLGDRPSQMDLYDTQDTLIFSLRRPFNFTSYKIEVIMNGSVVYEVCKQRTFFTPMFHINDAADRQVLRLKGDSSQGSYSLQTPDKMQIGTVSKKYAGFFKEAFTDNDTYLVQFPMDLDVNCKAAVIGSCVLINFIYH